MKKKRVKPVTKNPLCPRCKKLMYWSNDMQLHHCFQCGGWFVADRIKFNV